MALRNYHSAVQRLVNRQLPLSQIINRQSLLQANSQKLETRLYQILSNNVFFEGVEVEKGEDIDPNATDESLIASDIEFLSDLYSKTLDNSGDRMSGDWNVLPDIPEDRNAALSVEESIMEELFAQLHALPLSRQQIEVGEFLLNSMDSRGFLDDPEELIAYIYNNTGIPPEVSEETLQYLIENLEPRGILTRGVQASVKLQAEELPPSIAQITLVRVVDGHFEDLLNQDFAKLKRQFQLSSETTLKEVYDLCRAINPVPIPTIDRAISKRVKHDADVLVIREGGRYRAVLTDQSNPKILFNSDRLKTLATLSKQLQKGRRVGEEYSYLKKDWEAMESAKQWLHERRDALEQVIGYVLNAQSKFMATFNPDDLEPMLMKEVASQFNLSPSTLSRIASEKVIQTDTGRIIQLNIFFNQGIRTEEGHRVSAGEVKQRVLDILENEERNHPKTFVELTEDLRTLGYIINAASLKGWFEQWKLLDTKERKQMYLDQGKGYSGSLSNSPGSTVETEQTKYRKGLGM